MKCLTCGIREVEHEHTTLCAPCDRDEWKDATIGANKRFQYAEDLNRDLHQTVGRFLTDNELVVNYPCNIADMLEAIKGLPAVKKEE